MKTFLFTASVFVMFGLFQTVDFEFNYIFINPQPEPPGFGI